MLSFHQMKSDSRASMASVHAQISQRIDESITLLESLACLPEFYSPEIPPIEKVRKLDQMSPFFGYMMICYVDAEITVYSDGSEPASLASRDYMQRLFSTGQTQVTDSFAAGADGVTLNYTVAVPLFDRQKDITGCLFCAIYFDEVVNILDEAAGIHDSKATLIGSTGTDACLQRRDFPMGIPYSISCAVPCCSERLRINCGNSSWRPFPAASGAFRMAAHATRHIREWRIQGGM